MALAGEIKLARHPDYHQGKIVFSYLGDLWLVNEDGSQPRRLTVNRARDVHPRFSPDGKWIAFSSNRYGNYDVFVIPAQGGTPKQLTFHSAADTVVGWSRDSRRIIFTSPRGLLYPNIPNLYEVPVSGGLERPMLTDWGYWGSYSPDGKRFAFNRHPMVWWRKHYRGSYAADLWVLDVDANRFRRVLDDKLPDDQKPNNLWPMYGADGWIYFVSDRDVMAKAGSPQVLSSTNNLWKVRDDGSEPVQVTRHKSGALFWPSLSADGKILVYEENFGLWKLDVPTGRTTQVKIELVSDDQENNFETLTVNGEADSFHLSPSAKRAVISTHGELFTIATERGDIRRLTRTPSVRETQPRWSPDGKWIAFVGDQSGREEVWVCDERGGQLKQISDGDAQKGQLAWSPDAKHLLYTTSENKLYKYSFATGKTVVMATGNVLAFGGVGILNPQWSPDGKWISYTKANRNLLPHVYVISTDGGTARRITDDDSYSDSSALWTPDGKRLVYLAGGDVGNIGQSGRSTAQLYTVSLQPEDSDPADKSVNSEEDAAKVDRSKLRQGPLSRPDGDDAGAAAMARSKVEVKIDFNRIGRRARQLTRSGDAIGNMAIAPDGRTVVFTTSGTEGGRPVRSIWSVQIDGDKLTRVTQSGRASEEGATPRRFGGLGGFSALQFSKDGRTLFYKEGRGIYAVAVGGGLGGAPSGRLTTGDKEDAPTPTFSRAAGAGAGAAPRKLTFAARVEIDHRAERRQVFQESWRVMKHRFYAADMHGVDWNKMKAIYEPLLDHVADQEELHDVISQMIGELNASHTGVSGGRVAPGEAQGQTRFPGFDLEADPSGYYKVTHVYRHGPADKDHVKLSAGNFILDIDGQELKAGDNYWKAYAGSPSGKFEFTVNNKPAREGAWRTRVTPVTNVQHATLQYEKWVADRRAMVDRLSGGQVGYLHIRQMDEASLRKFERDLMQLSTKKALVIDQRFNPGGGIDQELLQILQQKQYQVTRLRDSVHVTRPLRGFFGPMVVMANERSTSDAEVFPDGFRTLKLGKIVGVTTYGAVIGTGSYQLMDGSAIRTPGSGLWNVNGTNLENFGVPPDVYVDNTPEDFFRGRDAQLEKAVEILRTELSQRK
jgi:tricorn protease